MIKHPNLPNIGSNASKLNYVFKLEFQDHIIIVTVPKIKKFSSCLLAMHVHQYCSSKVVKALKDIEIHFGVYLTSSY